MEHAISRGFMICAMPWPGIVREFLSPASRTSPPLQSLNDQSAPDFASRLGSFVGINSPRTSRMERSDAECSSQKTQPRSSLEIALGMRAICSHLPKRNNRARRRSEWSRLRQCRRLLATVLSKSCALQQQLRAAPSAVDNLATASMAEPGFRTHQAPRSTAPPTGLRRDITRG